MKRYSIIVRERGSNNNFELCQCDSNPEPIMEGARNKRRLVMNGMRKIYEPLYEHVEFRENGVG